MTKAARIAKFDRMLTSYRQAIADYYDRVGSLTVVVERRKALVDYFDESITAAAVSPRKSESLRNVLSKLESQILRNPDLPEAYRQILAEGYSAIDELEAKPPTT